MQSASWYSTPPCKVGRKFTEVLAAEWQGVLNRRWNPDRPFVLAHMVLTKTLGNHHLVLWERGIHAGMVGDVLDEGKAREGRVKRRKEEEEEDSLVRCFHSTLLSGKLW